ncbi:mannonate dehydratase [Jannaschia donghaensis]|uniref:Mannonate dehydratase n=1 Tax=Jannaschia donghaensis TaxID=420998 RepID=A0A0M6YGX4_9RHOB|nr:mannonate dehydratase [Jannaschia donghaensis]CTQ48517.1 Mannonate dehydratase [Jannaschia donghaensis]
MKQTWRWFGPQDAVTTADMLQSGVEGVVTALHHIPPGAVWSTAEIQDRQRAIAFLPDGTPSGLGWDVVESLPVSEAIKTQGPDLADHLDAYRVSLRNLAACGIETICYNFMPVLDWTRTDLRRPMPHGGNAMAFDLTDFAVFDLCLLNRAGAVHDYGDALRDAAHARHAAMDDATRKALVDNVVAGLPGANDGWTLEEVRAHLAAYADIDAAGLRVNLIDFLSEVAPLAQELGLRLCCHPDDPPFPLLGLPRVMSSQSDYAAVIQAVDTPANGVTFCTGSLGVDPAFDPVAFVGALGHRIHFAHLRNTRRDGIPDGARTGFHEALHLDGDTDMVATIRALMAEEARRRDDGRADHAIPMRPDHGQQILSDLTRASAPGYPLIGRMRGLAELRGVMAAVT